MPDINYDEIKPKTPIGRNLLKFMRQRNMNFYQLGKLLQKHPGWAAKIVRGDQEPGSKNLKLISEKTRIKIDDLERDIPLEKIPKPELDDIVIKLKKVVYLPFFGAGPANRPIDIEQIVGERMPLSPSDIEGFDEEKLFTLKASGDSLIKDEIEDGDTLIVERFAAYEPGELYVVNIRGNGVTVKHKVVTPDGKIHLISANDNYPEMVYDEPNTDTLGKVVKFLKPARKPQKRLK